MKDVELLQFLREKLSIPEPGSPESDAPFAPRLESIIGARQYRSVAVSQDLALRPGSCLVCNVAASSTFSKAISGTNLSIIMLTTVMRGDFVNKEGELQENEPHMGGRIFWIFLYQVNQSIIDDIQEGLALEHNVGSFYIPVWRSIAPITGDNLNRSQYEFNRKKKTKKRKKKKVSK